MVRTKKLTDTAKHFRHLFYPEISEKQWRDWKWQLQNRVRDLKSLRRFFQPTEGEVRGFNGPHFSFALTPYTLSTIELNNPQDPIRRTLVPSEEEFNKSFYEAEDPLGEEPHRPVSAIVHRYPDRVLFLATGHCAAYCRYCTRSRLVGDKSELRVNTSQWQEALDYISEHEEIRDVLITGGDPLTLSDEKIEWLLSSLRKISHVEFIRFGTKVPFILPQRITPQFCKMLKKYHPIWMSLHIIHPNELQLESRRACERLANAGVPLGGHTVLLAGINDDIETMKRLVHELLKVRVKPYYLFHCDPVKGSSHFRTSVKKGIDIIDGLRGHTSGYAVPHYAIDIPGKGGKVTLAPNYLIGRDRNNLKVRNFRGEVYSYPDPTENVEEVYSLNAKILSGLGKIVTVIFAGILSALRFCATG